VATVAWKVSLREPGWTVGLDDRLRVVAHRWAGRLAA
jgi:hypothetical protein